MDVPRVFISSTYYDLKHLRSIFLQFEAQIGFEFILFERGDISYGGSDSIEEAIMLEIESCDILVSIIGRRYGSRSKDEPSISISEREVRHALEMGCEVFVFVDPAVKAEYQTYLNNKDSALEIIWTHVENIEIFHFLEYFYNLNRNNAVFEFVTSSELLSVLKSQFAGLFKKLLLNKNRLLINSQVSRLVDAVEKVDLIIEYIKKRDTEDVDLVDDMMFSSHPIFGRLALVLDIGIRVFFESIEELNRLFDYAGFQKIPEEALLSNHEKEYYYWGKTKGSEDVSVRVSKELFSQDGKLKPISNKEWNNKFVVVD